MNAQLRRTTVLLPVAVLLGVASAGAQVPLPVRIVDGDLADADWTTVVFANHPDVRVTALQVATGGGPGSFRLVRHDMPAASPDLVPRTISLHLRRGAVYDPRSTGAVHAICYEEDARLLQGFGQGQTTGPALVQDGRYFVADLGLTGSSTTWHHLGPRRFGADDFREVRAPLEGRPDVHPDFSQAGGEIQLGFRRSNTSSSGGYVMEGALDNWSVEVNCTGPGTPTSPSAPRDEPTPTSSPTPAAALGVCASLARRVPPQVIANALANPAGVAGYGLPCNPNLPAGPWNPLRRMLALQNPSRPFHPIFNTVVWKCGCS